MYISCSEKKKQKSIADFSMVGGSKPTPLSAVTTFGMCAVNPVKFLLMNCRRDNGIQTVSRIGGKNSEKGEISAERK